MTTKHLISFETIGALKRAGVLALKRAELLKVEDVIVCRKCVTMHSDD
jgi:hypothetical protein